MMANILVVIKNTQLGLPVRKKLFIDNFQWTFCTLYIIQLKCWSNFRQAGQPPWLLSAGETILLSTESNGSNPDTASTRALNEHPCIVQ